MTEDMLTSIYKANSHAVVMALIEDDVTITNWGEVFMAAGWMAAALMES